MPRPASRHPTDLELEILKILWQRRSGNGRDVQAALRPGRNPAYTSVITVLNVMTRKGYLSRKKVGGSFTYQPRVSERVTARKILRDVLRRVFGGSVNELVLGLLEDQDLNLQELQALRELVRRKAGGRGKGGSS